MNQDNTYPDGAATCDFYAEGGDVSLYFNPGPEDGRLIVTWPRKIDVWVDHGDDSLELSMEDDAERWAALTKLLAQLGEWARQREANQTPAPEKID